MKVFLKSINLLKQNIIDISDYYENNFKSMIEYEIAISKHKSSYWDDWIENITKNSTIENEISDKPGLYQNLLQSLDEYQQNSACAFKTFNENIIDFDRSTYLKVSKIFKLLQFSYESDMYYSTCIIHLSNIRYEVVNLIEDVIKEIVISTKNSDMEFSEHLFKKCMNIQANRTYYKTNLQEINKAREIEDVRNRGIRDMLDSDKYTILDQTQIGISPNRINPGEVDLLIKKDDKPLAFIECLNLENIDRKSIFEHLDKLFDYDAWGTKHNFIIVYYDGDNLLDFYAKYSNVVKENNKYNGYILLDSNDIDSKYAEIKRMSTKFKREDSVVEVEHFILKMPKAK